MDKFQGQQAPIVIYSMATSRPEEAPRGLEFLYSLNRLNVATSRAQCAVILVASPHLFEPDCSTPRQMKLANALCRYRELARVTSTSAARPEPAFQEEPERAFAAVELDSTAKRESFEAQRAQLSSVRIVTYDELFTKLKVTTRLLEGAADAVAG